jgi:glycerol-3-phosphate dehydrogenase
MAKDVVDAACKILGMKKACVTEKKPLAGGLPMGYDDYLKEAVPEMSARHKINAETVRHLIQFYGSRAERVLELVDMDPPMGEAISPESRDIYAQVVYSTMEEGARTLSDIVLRRMYLGMTGTRGRKQAEKIAEVAGRELKWSGEEKQQHLENYHKDLSKDNDCLKQ